MKSYRVHGLLWKVFSSVHCPPGYKGSLYITLVGSKLLYCSPIWHRRLLIHLENVQRRATDFILNNYVSNYRLRSLHLHLQPLMMVLEIGDILFFVKCLKEPLAHFNIFSFVTFCSGQTQSAMHFKLRQTLPLSNYSIRNSYFNRLPCLWNSLPLFNLDHSVSIVWSKLYKPFWNRFITKLQSR